MTLLILQILATLIPFILTAIAKHQETVNSAQYKIDEDDKKIEKAIASRDADAVTLLLNDYLQRLQDKSNHR